MILSGCSDGDEADEKYFATFEHIKTDQFSTLYGQSGIYWISDEKLILNAEIEDAQGSMKRGIYEVNMDGTYKLLIDTESVGRHRYCFNGGVFYIRNKDGNIKISNNYDGYKIAISKLGIKQRNNFYSPVRCGFAAYPLGAGGYVALKKKDGFVKYIRDSESPNGFYSYIENDNGLNTSSVEVGKKPMISNPRYLQVTDEYFFQNFSLINRGCATFRWLNRQDWSIKEKNLCFDQWIESTSKIANSTKVGLFVEQHTRRYPSAYLITEASRYPIESTAVIRAAVSPNGCKVAYGFGDYTSKSYTQELKVFDACQFMKDKQIEIANTPPKKKSDRRIEQPTNYESHASKLGY
jgi:hypothetical protein